MNMDMKRVIAIGLLSFLAPVGKAVGLVPELTLTITPVSGAAPLTVTANASCSASDPCLAYAWDFQDGSSGITGRSVSHTFTAAGSYDVVVAATDANGNPAIGDEIVTVTAPSTPTSDAIMGFESLGTWDVIGSAARSGFMVTTTTDRTQGKAAYSIANPPGMTKLISQPIASSATALAGIGNTGALLQIDIQIPTNSGYITGQVSSPSHGLHDVLLGQVDFSPYRTGIYNTISFNIPDEVSSALGGATFSDLVFEFSVSSPAGTTGAYLFDNLRVHYVELVQSPTGAPPPPGYGGSVNLVVLGNKPVTQTSDLGPTQIPDAFHLKMGTAGTTTVRLQLGLDGTPAFTCTYSADATDTTGHSYILKSCTRGFNAGDLVNSNWVHLAIVGGDATQQIRAQLAMNPMGDLTGAGLLPPMPTFWGDADTCTPAPVSGTVVTTSPSCANQVAEANEIISNYFTQLIKFNPAPNWIVMPVPEFALRHGDATGSEVPKSLSLTPDDASNEPIVFDEGQHLSSGGTWDAYWNLKGNLTPTVVAGTDENDTLFNATFLADVVLRGTDVSLMAAIVTADTDSGQTTPASKPATSSGDVSFVLFGGPEIPPSGPIVPSAGFSVNSTFTKEFPLLPIHAGIIVFNLGATADVGLTASGDPASSGLKNITVTPHGDMGVHLKAGIDILLGSGTVDTNIDLLSVSTPVAAQAQWALDSSDSSAPFCAIGVTGSATGEKTYSSAGGAVDLNATIGICPLCWTGSLNLINWEPMPITTSNLFTDPLDSKFRLPAGLAACGKWQGTASGHILKCTQRDSNGCCLARKEKVGSVPVTATFSQNGTSVSGTVDGESVTGTNINGVVSLSTTPIANICGPIEVSAEAVGTISSDSSTFSGQVYINNNHNVKGDFTLQYTGP